MVPAGWSSPPTNPLGSSAAMQHRRPLRVNFDGSRPKETSPVATDRFRIGAPQHLCEAPCSHRSIPSHGTAEGLRPRGHIELGKFRITVSAAVWVRNVNISGAIAHKLNGLLDGRHGRVPFE